MTAETLDQVRLIPATGDRWKDAASQLADVSPSFALELNDAESDPSRDRLGSTLRAAQFVFNKASGEEAEIARVLATETEAALAAPL